MLNSKSQNQTHQKVQQNEKHISETKFVHDLYIVHSNHTT